MMKTLKIYMDNGEYVVEKVTEFDHSRRNFFATENGLKECLNAYKPVLDEYELEVSADLWAMVINHINTMYN